MNFEINRGEIYYVSIPHATGHEMEKDRLATMCGLRDQGRVIDKLVREKMLDLREPGYCGRHYICPACGAGLDEAPSGSHPCPACGHGGG